MKGINWRYRVKNDEMFVRADEERLAMWGNLKMKKRCDDWPHPTTRWTPQDHKWRESGWEKPQKNCKTFSNVSNCWDEEEGCGRTRIVNCYKPIIELISATRRRIRLYSIVQYLGIQEYLSVLANSGEYCSFFRLYHDKKQWYLGEKIIVQEKIDGRNWTYNREKGGLIRFMTDSICSWGLPVRKAEDWEDWHQVIKIVLSLGHYTQSWV